MARITAELTAGYAVSIESEGHLISADEPENLGGTDTGPSPYELLLSSLAACTCITISMYCERKGWALERVQATFSHDRIHADDCEECEKQDTGYLDRIRSHVTIEGDFDDDQRERLQQVALRCPVHKTLEKGVTLFDTVEVA